MRVIYLFDIDGWALEDIGHALGEALRDTGIEIVPVRFDRWLASPVAGDVLYWSWSGMVRPGLDVSRHVRHRITTIHDPQEVSHFENRADWRRFPCKPLYWLDAVDRISVISDELHQVMATRYDRVLERTPTWPAGWRRLRAAQDRPERAVIKAVSSTKLPARFTMRQMLARRHDWSSYLVDSRRRVAPRQLLGAMVRTRRKNLPLLAALARHGSTLPGVSCDFVGGGPRFTSRADYERWLADADIYVCASTMEGGPLPVMEAVLSGLAVISTPVGQVADWVEDGQNGFIVSGLADFRRALERYARDPALLRRHQGASREKAADFAPPIEPWVRFLTQAG